MKRVLALRSRYGSGGRELTDTDKYLELFRLQRRGFDRISRMRQ
jgi:hypothetical protein